ncbi:hypothetical protein BV20DRAFT_95340 [Pilatotrama ljubarskyi]|nr:hypothetical protein BV20DRAFT_95340 [Pilatotrama ljubarskyi]
MVSVLAANLVSTFVECTLYGIFLLLSFSSLALLARRQRDACRALCHASRLSLWPHRLAFVLALLKSPLILVNVLLILTITAHWLIGMHRVYIAVVDRVDRQQAADYISNLREGLEVARTAVLFVDMVLGDVVIAYRTWLVWKRDYRAVAVPCLTLSGLVASGIGLLHVFTSSGLDGGIFTIQVGRWILGYCVATLATNLYCTVMIAYRIYTFNKASKQNGLFRANGSNLSEALAIFVESAALYSAWATLFVILYATRSPLQTMGSGCGPSMIGIAFMLITVRVGLGWGQRSLPAAGDEPLAFNQGNAQALQLGTSSFPMQTITLDITCTVDQEIDYSLRCKSGEDARRAFSGDE